MEGLDQSQIFDVSDSSSEKASSALRAMKGPMDYGSEEEITHPDLADYFLCFDLTPAEQIRICRAYASYLTASQPPKLKRSRTKKSFAE